MVNIKLWTDESLAAGKLTTVWVKAKGVPRTLKNFHGLCEVGSTLGLHLEADMENMKKTGQVRLKVGVVNHLKIPKWTQITTKKLNYYRIYFQLEEIVELGWERPEEEFLQDFEDVIDSQTGDANGRDPKRQKQDNQSAPSPSGQMVVPDVNVVARTKTLLALAAREQNLKEQDDVDIRTNAEKTGKILFAQAEENHSKQSLGDNSGDTDMRLEVSEKSDERVNLSDAELDEYAASQNDSFTQKVKAYNAEGFLVDKNKNLSQNESQDELGPRYSGRLAEKNTSDMPIMEKAINKKAKEFEQEEGFGGRKNGTAGGRKTAGAGR